MAGKLAARVKGLSEAAFREAFGTEAQCRAALERLRWPKGFVCPACGHGGRAWLAERKLFQCNRCKHQVPLTAGTIFHATKLPLTTWFLAIHLIVTAKNGISSVELGRRLGVKQTTAWSMKHKIMQVMLEREAKKPLQGRVEIDDAYLGGARSGDKRGRGAAGKTPIVAAVETTAERWPRKLKLLPVKGFRKKEVEKLAREHLAPGSTVVSDGLSCWAAVEGAGCDHFPMVTGSGRQAARWAPFKWVNTTLGNIKAAITGTYRQLGPAHAARYLASFAWRFNRRFQLDSMLVRFVHSAARTKPMPYRVLVAG
ncbi:IS1595 family transposase [Benzoatithermus flavus]|uniref:IS1595 family transposase n=1 Tax=Benzoatithermus flavus TaxID=3108223 RepID=A0ABU8XYD1_9PROT